MASTYRQDDAPLSGGEPGAGFDRGRLLRDRIVRDAATYPFSLAVALLERVAPSGAAPVGGTGPVSREQLRFTHDAEFVFPAGDIAGAKVERDGVRLAGTFLGLVGPSSPLPTHFAEELLELEGGESTGALRTLYDLLHHRLYALFYRATRKYRAGADARSDGTDPFTRRALAFVGVDHHAMPDGGLPGSHLLGLAPLLAIRSRSGRALQVLLEASLPNVPVDVETFIERIVVLDETERNQLGIQNCELGTSFTIGARVLDRAGRFRARLGPVGYQTLEDLMPNGRHHDRLRQVLDQFTRGILEAEVEIILDENQTPKFQLGASRGGNLGVDTILGRLGNGPSRVRFTMSADPSGVRPQFIGPVGSVGS